jgi:hypothetical protein
LVVMFDKLTDLRLRSVTESKELRRNATRALGVGGIIHGMPEIG